jgi:hypothetical protein
MRKFEITVQPQRRLFRCEKMRDENARGLYGFHSYDKCPDCKVTLDGFALWGENGHLQGVLYRDERPTEADLKEWADRVNRYAHHPAEYVFRHREQGHTYLAN